MKRRSVIEKLLLMFTRRLQLFDVFASFIHKRAIDIIWRICTYLSQYFKDLNWNNSIIIICVVNCEEKLYILKCII